MVNHKTFVKYISETLPLDDATKEWSVANVLRTYYAWKIRRKLNFGLLNLGILMAPGLGPRGASSNMWESTSTCQTLIQSYPFCNFVVSNKLRLDTFLNATWFLASLSDFRREIKKSKKFSSLIHITAVMPSEINSISLLFPFFLFNPLTIRQKKHNFTNI